VLLMLDSQKLEVLADHLINCINVPHENVPSARLDNEKNWSAWVINANLTMVVS
jgi:hypothetical protein